MPFTPKSWQDWPSEATPRDAAAFIDMEERLAAYAETQPGPAGADGATGPAGATGPQGPQGDPGATGATGATGPPGTDGDDGAPGADGEDGNTVLYGTDAPTTEGVDGDFYIRTTTNFIYGPKSGTWPAGASLVGPQGDTGATGATGPQGDPGATGATGAAGTNGTNGTNGADGKTILYGTAAPTTEGVNGDFYIRTTTNFIYGPKAGGSWPSGTSLIGPAGSDATVPDADASTKGKIQLTGDLGGTAASPTVPGLSGKAASSHTHAPTDVTGGSDGEVLTKVSGVPAWAAAAGGGPVAPSDMEWDDPVGWPYITRPYVPVRNAGEDTWKALNSGNVGWPLAVTSSTTLGFVSPSSFHTGFQTTVSKASNASLAAADQGKLWRLDSTSARTFTLPNGLNTGMANGGSFYLMAVNTGTMTLATGTSVIVNGVTNPSFTLTRWTLYTLTYFGTSNQYVATTQAGI